MGRMSFTRQRLAELRDGNGDLAPPWARYPTYERLTIGWRMGDGEDWFAMWHVFLEDFDPAVESRRAYLLRHPPAPVSWADTVYRVLYPATPDIEGEGDDGDGRAGERRDALRREGLIATDAAYPTWLARQQAVRWPWENTVTLEEAARYWTREFWFWSRRVNELRAGPGWQPPAVPAAWRAIEDPLRTGDVPSPDPRTGLLTLARMLAAGRVWGPWHLGLTPAAFADTFADDMGYADAFRLWGLSAFDDREHLNHHLAAEAAPEEWRRWAAAQFYVD